jgi:hypothetical protein
MPVLNCAAEQDTASDDRRVSVSIVCRLDRCRSRLSLDVGRHLKEVKCRLLLCVSM